LHAHFRKAEEILGYSHGRAMQLPKLRIEFARICPKVQNSIHNKNLHPIPEENGGTFGMGILIIGALRLPKV